MLAPERAKPGLPVTVRQKPIVVGDQTFGSHPFHGIITALDTKGSKGAYVRHPKGGEHFATWEEMSPRRLKEGEE